MKIHETSCWFILNKHDESAPNGPHRVVPGRLVHLDILNKI